MAALADDVLSRIPAAEMAVLLESLPQAGASCAATQTIIAPLCGLGPVQIEFHLHKYRHRGPHFSWEPVRAIPLQVQLLDIDL